MTSLHSRFSVEHLLKWIRNCKIKYVEVDTKESKLLSLLHFSFISFVGFWFPPALKHVRNGSAPNKTDAVLDANTRRNTQRFH